MTGHAGPCTGSQPGPSSDGRRRQLPGVSGPGGALVVTTEGWGASVGLTVSGGGRNAPATDMKATATRIPSRPWVRDRRNAKRRPEIAVQTEPRNSTDAASESATAPPSFAPSAAAAASTR